MRDILLVTGLIAIPATVSHRQDCDPAAIRRPDPRLHRLEEYFAKRDCPLRTAAADFIDAADKYSLDWRLLPSISMVESSGGKDYRNNNVFGWDSCRESFTSVRAGIHFVAGQLANSRRYRNKSLDRKLQTYNPDPEYPHRVKAVMRSLAPNGEVAVVAVSATGSQAHSPILASLR